MTDLRSYFSQLEPSLIEWLTDLVNFDSPSGNKAALDALARKLAGHFERCGATLRWVPNSDTGDHLLVRFEGDASKAPVLILGHLDTVWEIGEAERRPARLEDGKLFGPGAFDMRGGLTLMMGAASYVSSHPGQLQRPVTLLLSSDEEVGSHTSRSLIEAEGRRHGLVLVLEPCLPGGALKTARKGVGTVMITARGVASHAGVDYARGVSAIREMAHQIGRIYQMNDPDKGTTLNVGVIRGGTRSNVVAERAEMEVDFRVWTAEEGQRIERELRELTPTVEGTTLEVTGGLNRPPLERSPATIKLFQRAKSLAAEIGLELQEGSTGGGSDGCFTAALGIPTLDGLGPDGAGPHALHEHVLVESLAPRAALLTQLILNLDAG
ncbi:MAG: M20 family metallopeptidase [Acidobacteriota bacterium]